jgi:aryl-alcohol dehydrogenase-like predicted oxidoreductase
MTRREDPVTDLRTPIALGQTGLRTSRLGIGSSFTTDARVIEEAVDQGVNYLYWGSLRRSAFGRAIRAVAQRARDRVVVTVQSYTRVAVLMAPSIEIALRRTGLASFDFLLLGMWNRPPGPALVDAALRLKERGLVRHLMLSTHNRPSLQDHFRAFERGESPYDVFMLRYNAVHRGAEQDVFPHLPLDRRPGVLAYTATRWGHLCDPAKMPAGESPPPARDCYRFALSHPAVDMVLCGPKDREQMQEALRALDAGPLAPEEMARMQRIGDHIYGRYRPQFAEQGDRIDA